MSWNSSLLDDIHEDKLSACRIVNLGGLTLHGLFPPDIRQIRKLDEGCAFEKAAKKGKVVVLRLTRTEPDAH